MIDGPFQTPVSLNEQNNDINAYFARKKPQRPKNGVLFKFDSSAHNMSFNNYLKDHRYSSLNLTVSILCYNYSYFDENENLFIFLSAGYSAIEI